MDELIEPDVLDGLLDGVLDGPLDAAEVPEALGLSVTEGYPE